MCIRDSALRLHPQQLHGVRTRADVHAVLADGQRARGQLGAVRNRLDLDELEPLTAEDRPRAGRRGAAAHHPVHAQGGGVPVDVGVLDIDLRRLADALARLRYGLQRAVLDPVHGRREQPGTGEGEPGQQIAAGVGGPDRLGHGPVDGPGVEPLLDEEGGRAGDLVPRHDRVLHGRGPTPGGQQGEVQVDPPMGRNVEGDPRQQRPIGHHGTAVRRDLPQPLQELRIPRLDGLQHLDPRLRGPLRDGRGDQPPPPAGRSVGARHHGGHLMPTGGEQGVQSGNGDLGGTGEDKLHG